MLAERFATKCFSPLELTHFKDNFFSRALEQGGIRYWNEKTLSDFLGVPDGSFSGADEAPLDAGPVLFRMVSYLGAFPFQNTLAPSVLTFEAMVKVVVLLTERYGKVLRRGRKDRIKLLFGSLADVGRKEIGQLPDKGAESKESGTEESPEPCPAKSHAPGFSIDEPANDEYDEDEDDDLALAALESLDAIEVFKHDHRVDRTVYETRISVDTFRRLLMLLLVIAPLKPLEPVEMYTSDLGSERVETIQKVADSILAAFRPEETEGGITYRAFAQTISTSLPYLFDPLTALFEHLLFSKNLNLSQRRPSEITPEETAEEKPEGVPVAKPILLPGSFESSILNSTILAQMSFFLPSKGHSMNLFKSGIRLHPVFSTATHGSSLTSFSHNVLTWQSANLLILQGAPEGTNDEIVTIGAYLPQSWKSSSSHGSSSSSDPLPCLFQLSPKHQVLPGNPSPSVQKQTNLPPAWFSTHTGIAIGCQIPPASRSHHTPPIPHGAASLTIDVNLESAEFRVEPVGHDGVFLPSGTTSMEDSPVKICLNLYSLEIWGVVPDPELSASSDPNASAVELQRAKWEFEAKEAERRRNINLKTGVGDSSTESARWLLETAGIIGDHGQYSGGST
ncbi:Restriction of telomere capping protein 5 [Penicillium rolfsii]|nr:Restriction of telomere capping protein 5 [Penicillium rolfsii]